MWSNGPKEMVEYADYTFEDHFGRLVPSYPPRAVLYDYIAGRAKKGDIRKFIRFRTVVRHVDFDEESNKFLVTIEDLLIQKPLEILKFDHVIVATGHFSMPNMPNFEGVNQFPGRVLHSHDFRGADEFVNQRLLLIGGSYSAEDIALQCHKFGAESITISYRSRATGLKWPKNIKEVPLLQRFKGRTAYFKDGSSIDNIDCIIMCTGYRHHHPYMAEHLRDRCLNNPYIVSCLYKGIFWISQPKLAYLGMQNQFYSFTIFDIQAALVRDVFLGDVKLPDDDDEMARQVDLDEWQKREAELTPGDSKAEAEFQTDYLLDLLTFCNPKTAPNFDANRSLDHCYKYIIDHERNVLTYRDQPFVSKIYPFKEAPITTIPWIQNMDDSIQGFIANIIDNK